MALLACDAMTNLLSAVASREIDVFADQGWQQTTLDVVRGQQVTIQVISGRWFEDPPGVWHDGDGGPNAWRCGNPTCHEPLPDFPKYALIGKIGEAGEILPIGARLEFAPEQNGRLYLRPNYGDVDIPIFHPAGFLRVKITIFRD
jgi:hypothetical protein